MAAHGNHARQERLLGATVDALTVVDVIMFLRFPWKRCPYPLAVGGATGIVAGPQIYHLISAELVYLSNNRPEVRAGIRSGVTASSRRPGNPPGQANKTGRLVAHTASSLGSINGVTDGRDSFQGAQSSG